MVDYQTIFQFLQTVGILVGVFYYIMTIRTNQRNQEIALKNQELTLLSQELTRKAQEQALETREAQLMMQLWNSYTEYREESWFWRDIEYEDFDDFWERYGSDMSFWTKYGTILGWYENVGVLVKEGLLNMRLIALMYAGGIRQFWEKFEPLMDGLREKWDYPRVYSETAYLCETLIQYMEEHPELKT